MNSQFSADSIFPQTNCEFWSDEQIQIRQQDFKEDYFLFYSIKKKTYKNKALKRCGPIIKKLKKNGSELWCDVTNAIIQIIEIQHVGQGLRITKSSNTFEFFGYVLILPKINLIIQLLSNQGSLIYSFSEVISKFNLKFLLQYNKLHLYLQKQIAFTIFNIKINFVRQISKLLDKVYLFFDQSVDGWFKELKKFCIQKQIKNTFIISNKLGSGNYADVHRLIKQSDEKEFAVKIYDKQSEKFDAECVIKELEILRRMDHPNVITVLETFESKKYLFIVTELLISGNLDEIIQKTTISEEDAIKGIFKIIDALSYIHSKGVILTNKNKIQVFE